MDSSSKEETNFGYSRRADTHKYWCHICKAEFSIVPHEASEIDCIYCKKTFCEEIDLTTNDQPSNFVPYENPRVYPNSNNNNSGSGSINNNTRNSNNMNTSNPRETQESTGIRIFKYIGSNSRDRISNLILNSLIFGNSNNHGNVILSSGLRNSPNRGIGELLSTMSLLGSLGGLGSLGDLGGGINSSTDEGFENILNYLLLNDPNRYGNPPAAKKEVENLESVKITKNSFEELKKKMNHECSVCKEEFEINQELKKLPCCHIFHDDCLLPWLKQRNSCPTCRFELPTDDADYEKKRKGTRN